MSPATYNVSIYGGDDYVLPVDFVDSAGDPLDVSGRTYAAQVRAWPSGGVLATFDVDETNAAGGTIVLSLGHAVTAGLAGTVTEARWDLSQSVGGTLTTVMAGAVDITQDVTR